MITELIRSIQKPEPNTKPRFRIFWNSEPGEHYNGPALPPVYIIKIYQPFQTVWFDSSLMGMYGIKANGERI